jgi:hypothetical protein
MAVGSMVSWVMIVTYDGSEVPRLEALMRHSAARYMPYFSWG